MRHFTVIALLAFVITACGVSRQSPQEKRAEQERIAQTVQQMLDNRSYRIDVDYMLPLRGRSQSVTSYSVTIKENTIDSHLPYFGNVRSVPYGGGKGLVFTEDIAYYTDYGVNNDRRTIVINVKNDEDNYVYTLEIFNNGEASIYVQCRNRDNIRYRGSLNLD